MLKTFLKIAVRQLWQARLYALIINFVRIIFIAILLASLAGHYLMRAWLDHFAYHAGMPWWVFAGPGAAALLLALLTVSAQALRAAAADPVRVLRAE